MFVFNLSYAHQIIQYIPNYLVTLLAPKSRVLALRTNCYLFHMFEYDCLYKCVRLPSTSSFTWCVSEVGRVLLKCYVIERCFRLWYETSVVNVHSRILWTVVSLIYRWSILDWEWLMYSIIIIFKTCPIIGQSCFLYSLSDFMFSLWRHVSRFTCEVP